MKNFEIKGIVQEKDIPESHGGRESIAYEELFDRFSRIPAGVSIHVQVEKSGQVTSIRKACEKKFGKSIVQITQRKTKEDKFFNVYIIRKSN